MTDRLLVLLQVSSSPVLTVIQVVASILTIPLAGIQLYDYVSENDIYNQESGRSSASRMNQQSEIFSTNENLWERIQRQEDIRYLTLSLFSFVSISVSAVVDSGILTYLSVVLVGTLLINEYSNNIARPLGWWSNRRFVTKLIFGNIFFVFVLLIASHLSESMEIGISDSLLAISFVFLPAAIWFGFTSIVKIISTEGRHSTGRY
ncbi:MULTISPECIES: hypothetical protein [Haloferax]|uniref:Uncharacterized protein n=1 Tax=Haloferax marinum TaxID=2666143 RepID=A0A6A8G9S9_9EURY|nr:MULTISPECIES: hypothetical protein [Haloferax]KAB1198365.1 hypothetical protein Hfx1150_12925 [Haloferax sp. CBA1150]MRW97465.1 hypothetical protein [Haloferax marinum]